MNTHPVPLLNKAAAHEALQSYIFGGTYARTSLPSNIDPAYVQDFISSRMDRTRSPDSFNKARRAVDQYGLRGTTDHFQKMLDRTETESKHIHQSCRCVSILAEQGDAKTSAFASDYFAYLAAHRLASEAYDTLLETLESLDSKADARPLADRLTREMKALEPRIKADPRADDEYQQLDQHLNNELTNVLEVRASRARMLEEKDPVKRIEGLCRLYLEWESDATIESGWWSARHLRREFEAGERETVLAALRKILQEIDASKLPEEERSLPKARGLRAVAFFGGGLTEQEQKVLSKGGEDPGAILYRGP